jgi:hypothetical protein
MGSPIHLLAWFGQKEQFLNGQPCPFETKRNQCIYQASLDML